MRTNSPSFPLHKHVYTHTVFKVLCIKCMNSSFPLTIVIIFFRLPVLNWKRCFLREHICFCTAGIQANVECCYIVFTIQSKFYFEFFIQLSILFIYKMGACYNPADGKHFVLVYFSFRKCHRQTRYSNVHSYSHIWKNGTKT